VLKLLGCIVIGSAKAVGGRLGEAPLETVMNVSGGFAWGEASLGLGGAGASIG